MFSSQGSTRSLSGFEPGKPQGGLNNKGGNQTRFSRLSLELPYLIKGECTRNLHRIAAIAGSKTEPLAEPPRTTHLLS